MADAVYTKFKQYLLEVLHDNAIKVVLVDAADYTLQITTDDYLADIPEGARVATSGALTNKTITDGVFDADDVTFSAVTGDQFEYIVLYIDTGNAATSPIIAVWDAATGLPCTPSGGDITIAWSNGASKILKIT